MDQPEPLTPQRSLIGGRIELRGLIRLKEASPCCSISGRPATLNAFVKVAAFAGGLMNEVSRTRESGETPILSALMITSVVSRLAIRE